MAVIAKVVNDKDNDFEGITFNLANDIDLNAHEWVAIGGFVSSLDNSPFKGTFQGKDGQKSIEGLKTSETAGSQGLCGYVSGEDAEILNIKLIAPSIKGVNFVGGIVGYNNEANAIIQGSYNTGDV